MGALAAFAKAQGLPLQHLKAPRALGNVAFVDLEVSKTIARTTARYDKNVHLRRPGRDGHGAGSQEVGVRYVEEAYADRVYKSRRDASVAKDPRLRPSRPGKAAQQALTIVKEGYAIAHDGTKVSIKPKTSLRSWRHPERHCDSSENHGGAEKSLHCHRSHGAVTEWKASPASGRRAIRRFS